MTAETPEGRDHEAVKAGREAEHELTLVGEAFNLLRTEYQKLWMTTSPKEVEAREKLWLASQMISKVESHLKQMVADGKVAAKTLEKDAGVKRPFFNMKRSA